MIFVPARMNFFMFCWSVKSSIFFLTLARYSHVTSVACKYSMEDLINMLISVSCQQSICWEYVCCSVFEAITTWVTLWKSPNHWAENFVQSTAVGVELYESGLRAFFCWMSPIWPASAKWICHYLCASYSAFRAVYTEGTFLPIVLDTRRE